MTRETCAVAVFYPAVAADLVWPSPALHALIALAAAAFLLCQGKILHAGKGIPAWRHPLVPWMLVASGLYEGVALAILGLEGLVVLGFEVAFFLVTLLGLAGAAALLAGANAALFRAYRRGAAKAGVGPLSRRDLDAIAGRVQWLGRLAPPALFGAAGVMILLGGLAVYVAPQYVWIAGVGIPLALVAGAACALWGGALWKHTLVTRACHQQGFALPRLPRRGSGSRAAPARFGLS